MLVENLCEVKGEYEAEAGAEEEEYEKSSKQKMKRRKFIEGIRFIETISNANTQQTRDTRLRYCQVDI